MICRIASCALPLLVLASSPASAGEHAGQKVFTEHKCQSCHAVKSASIKGPEKEDSGTDLSGVGARHQPEWIKAYLLKKEKKDGRKHKKKFRGEDKELTDLVNWLASLK